jgi:hypothetical protein
VTDGRVPPSSGIKKESLLSMHTYIYTHTHKKKDNALAGEKGRRQENKEPVTAKHITLGR